MKSFSYAGTVDYLPRRFASYAGDTTVESIEHDAMELSSGRFVVIDPETEELLVRSYIKYDEILRQPRLAVSMVNAYEEVSSPVLRGVIVGELLALAEANPDLPSWTNPAVQKLLTEPSIDSRTLEPYNPVIPGFVGANLGEDLGQAKGRAVPLTFNQLPLTFNQLPSAKNEIAEAVKTRTDVEALCELLRDLIIENGNLSPNITKAWRDAARLILDRDGRDFEKTMNLIRWSQHNSFWRKNIMSMSKFRDKYDQLRLAAVEEYEKQQSKPKHNMVAGFDTVLMLQEREQQAEREARNRLEIEA